MASARQRRDEQRAPTRKRRTIDDPINLTKVVTRAGDRGEASLADGMRVGKDDPRVDAHGEVDELNAAVGLALAALATDSPLRPWLTRIQNELFDLGADLATPLADTGRSRLRIEDIQVKALDALCAQLNREQRPLRTFLLPGGGKASAGLHLARTVCRRAERRAVPPTPSKGSRSGSGGPAPVPRHAQESTSSPSL